MKNVALLDLDSVAASVVRRALIKGTKVINITSRVRISNEEVGKYYGHTVFRKRSTYEGWDES